MRRVGFEPKTPSVRAGEDSSCPRPRGHCDRPLVSTVRVYKGSYREVTLNVIHEWECTDGCRPVCWTRASETQTSAGKDNTG
jgi:hypothetical protein